MSGIDAPDARPALAWVLGLDKGWTTFAERCLLLVLACDSHDGYTCSPTREDVMRAAGMWGSQYYPALASLTSANDKRPALLAVEPHGRYRRNTYRLLRSPESATPARSPESATPQDDPAGVQSRSPEQESRAGVQSRSPESATHTLPYPLPTLREGEREEEALDAPPPGGGARPRPTGEQVAAIIKAVVPAEAMGTGIDSANPDLADAVADALAAGWTVERMTSALADMKAPKRTATGQALARLRDLAGKNPAAIVTADQVTAQTTPDTGEDADDDDDPADTPTIRRFAQIAKPTPTPRPASEVLAGDDRDPGADGFATIARPRKVRPPGHDQAVREADQAERQRQQDALDALSEDQLAALVALQQAHTTDQEDTA